MYAWVIYDIRKNKTCSRVAKRCKYFGLMRVQKSVFLGKMKRKWVRQLHNELSLTINLRTDCLYVVPMAQEAFSRTLQSGTMPSLQEIFRDQKVKFI